MEEDIRKVWRALRSMVKDACTFAEVKDLVGACGLPVEELSHLQQKPLPVKGASKSELLDAVDDLIKQEKRPAEAIQHLLDAFLQRKQHFCMKVTDCVQQFGWTVEDGRLRPSDIQIKEATVDMSQEVRKLLCIAYSRYTQGDYPGAMTAVCSALDTLTVHVYRKYSLGNPHDGSYQERACRSFQVLEKSYKARLRDAHLEDSEVIRIWQNHKGAVNQASYILGSFRRHTSDVHGLSECSPQLVRHAIDCGTFIIRSITTGMNGEAKQLDAFDF